MTISARIVADSISERHHRITTWVLTYPRFIHAEVMTHRVLSRNAASSRAIPVAKQIERIEKDPAMPVEWGLNKAGMQASEVLTPEEEKLARDLWLEGCRSVLDVTRRLAALKVHKQIVNRIAEAYSHMTMVCTATEWANFFTLRHHHMAQPEFRVLAELMAPVFRQSVPKLLLPGQWHLPFITWDDEVQGLDLLTLIKCSAARCARTSYLTHDGKSPVIADDLGLYDRLVTRQLLDTDPDPVHASPVEHQATPFFQVLDNQPVVPTPILLHPRSNWGYPFDTKWEDPEPWSANFRGWFQYRQAVPRQNATTFPWEK